MALRNSDSSSASSGFWVNPFSHQGQRQIKEQVHVFDETQQALNDALSQSQQITNRLNSAFCTRVNAAVSVLEGQDEALQNNSAGDWSLHNHKPDSLKQDTTSESGQLQHLISILPCGVIIVGANGKIKQCNTAASHMLGCSLLHQSWRDVVQESFQPQADDGHEVSLKSGRKVRVDTRALGYAPGQLIILTDLTETRRLQHQVAQNERLVYLGRMMASLAHQIRTPLAAITLQAANLQSPNLTLDLAKKFSSKIQKGLGLIERQVKDMLLFVRDGKTQKQPFTWQSVHQRVEFMMRTLIASREIQVVSEHPDKMCQLMGHEDDLVGAIQNIAENAIQAIPSEKQGIIEFRSNILENTLEMVIADNGKGMSESQQRQIFEPFYTSKQTGTGLGLAICKTIIQQHGGKIGVTSAPNQGARFKIQIPLPEQELKHTYQQIENPKYQQTVEELLQSEAQHD